MDKIYWLLDKPVCTFLLFKGCGLQLLNDDWVWLSNVTNQNNSAFCDSYSRNIFSFWFSPGDLISVWQFQLLSKSPKPNICVRIASFVPRQWILVIRCQGRHKYFISTSKAINKLKVCFRDYKHFGIITHLKNINT